MSGQIHLFKKILFLLAGAALFTLLPGSSYALEVKAQETSFYKDVFEQNVYYEGTSYLRLDRLYQALFKKQVQAGDVNIYDEVPDSEFFVNRHARKALSIDELKKGFQESDGPDASGNLKVVSGIFEGLHPNFLVEDVKGNHYNLKFDPSDNFELATSAEVIGSRFYYAIGYNVPQVTITSFASGQLVPAEGAKIIDDSGFNKALSAEKLEEYLLFLPADANGSYRASATKTLMGNDKGSLQFLGKRRGDSNDNVSHQNRRSLRALQIFSSWLNNTDVRPGTTADILVTENGQEVLKHYLVGFSSTLGSTPKGAKPPMHGHEYLFDFGEAAKAFFTLGFWEKPWQKRWREAGEKVSAAPAIGYFDNRYFDPSAFKTQLPGYAFKDVTRADGFWAAKIIKSFKDEEIKALVAAGQLSNQEDAESLAQILIERRDIIARYWYRVSNALDEFEFSGSTLSFKDLAVEASFVPASGNNYHFEVIAPQGNKGTRLASLDSDKPSLAIDASWFSNSGKVNVFIRTSRPGSSDPTPYVLVNLDAEKILGIMHED